MAQLPVRAALVAAAVAIAWAAFQFAGAEASERVRVFYPAGSCETHRLQVERFHRSANRWIPHPEHPEVEAGRCYWEDESFLLNELRVRCVDPGGAKNPSSWVVGVNLSPTNVSVCDESAS